MTMNVKWSTVHRKRKTKQNVPKIKLRALNDIIRKQKRKVSKSEGKSLISPLGATQKGDAKREAESTAQRITVPFLVSCLLPNNVSSTDNLRQQSQH